MPTESEWEYAARAGCAYKYCKRDGSEATLDEVAWWGGNSVDSGTDPSLKPVMQLEPNSWGLWDVYGNVHEFNATWVGTYSEEPTGNPPGPPSPSQYLRTLRGGSVADQRKWVVPSGRSGQQPDCSFLVCWSPRGDRGGVVIVVIPNRFPTRG